MGQWVNKSMAVQSDICFAGNWFWFLDTLDTLIYGQLNREEWQSYNFYNTHECFPGCWGYLKSWTNSINICEWTTLFCSEDSVCPIVEIRLGKEGHYVLQLLTPRSLGFTVITNKSLENVWTEFKLFTDSSQLREQQCCIVVSCKHGLSQEEI